MSSEFSVCILTSELPLDSSAGSVASALPLVDLELQAISVGHASIQALPTEDPDLYLGHFQPTGVFGGVVELDAPQQLSGCVLAQYVNETLSQVDVQVVEHEMDAPGGRIGASEQHV